MPFLNMNIRTFTYTYFEKGGDEMNQTDVPIWEKYTLTIEEAAKYFRIGENKLRKLVEENPTANWVILNGNVFRLSAIRLKK